MSHIQLEAEIESRIIGKGMEAFRRLSNSQQRTIVEFLECNRRETIMSPLEVINAYLTWEGIINYTDQITNLVLNAYNADIQTFLIYCPHEGMTQSLFLNYAEETLAQILHRQMQQDDAGCDLLYSMLQTSSLWDDHTPALYDSLIIQFGHGMPALIQLARDLGWRVEMISNFYDDHDFNPFSDI